MALFCRHEWVKECEKTFSRADGILGALECAPMRFFMKKYVVIFRCTKCSKLKKFVEEI